MNRYRKLGLLILMLIVVMQFVQPKRNQAEGLSQNDISKVYSIPSDLHKTFVNKCYDCHSNNTRYPWYSNIQPIGWWLAAHVHDGKEELNFAEFKTYNEKRKAHKMEELQEVAEDRSMPLKAYTMFHKNAELTENDEQMIKDWIATLNLPPKAN
jgi:hypothetical protein